MCNVALALRAEFGVNMVDYDGLPVVEQQATTGFFVKKPKVKEIVSKVPIPITNPEVRQKHCTAGLNKDSSSIQFYFLFFIVVGI